MAYTNINKSSDHFNTVAWTGTSSSPTNVTGYGFNPDMIWNKYRSGAGDHQLYDAVRTATKMIIPNSTAAESTNANGVTAFISDGFTAGSDINVNGGNSVAWGWKANGAGSANTDGDITSTVSANTTAGFSIVKYTGNGSASNIGHGLGAAPKVVLIKKTSGSADWLMGHQGLHASTPWKYGINLSNTDARHESGSYFADTAPTTSVFRVEANSEVNSNGDNYIAYCFAEKTGFSKFGSYTGTDNVDSPFLYCGFKPAFFLVKNYTSGTGESWHMYDNKRLGYNPANSKLIPNNNSAEATETKIDFVSNGIKIRSAGDGHLNQNTKTYIWMAFAEAPLVGSNNVPCTAR